jgi:hypothetical protein
VIETTASKVAVDKPAGFDAGTSRDCHREGRKTTGQRRVTHRVRLPEVELCPSPGLSPGERRPPRGVCGGAFSNMENEMNIDGDQLLENALRNGVRESVKKCFESSYNSPLEPLIKTALGKYNDKLRAMLEDGIASCIDDKAFRDNIAAAVRHSLAKTLIQRFGGEMEKQVNVLKSDPTTRARITLAIEEIVKSKAS